MNNQQTIPGRHPGRNNVLFHGKPAYQSGAVLVVSLIMLLLLTLISTAGMQSSSLEEKMAGNMRDRNLAFQAAESALKAGETAAATTALTITCITNKAGYYLPGVNCDGTTVTAPVWDNSATWSNETKSVKFDADDDDTTIDLAHLSANPRYIVEDMGASCAIVELPCQPANQRHTYRITARATGGTTNAMVMLQSLYQINKS